MERKTVLKYIDRGFGFPIVLEDLSMVKIRGEWTPQIDYIALAKVVLHKLSQLEGRLTGNQVKFIRLQLEMKLQDFAERFAVTHPAVLKWERAREKPTGMAWSTEKDIRLSITDFLSTSPNEFKKLYKRLESEQKQKAPKITVDGESMAA